MLRFFFPSHCSPRELYAISTCSRISHLCLSSHDASSWRVLLCWLQNGVAGFRASATVQDRLYHLLWLTWSELLVLVVCLLAPRHTPFPFPAPSPLSPTGCVFQTQVGQWKAPTGGSLEDRKRRSHSISPFSLP